MVERNELSEEDSEVLLGNLKVLPTIIAKNETVLPRNVETPVPRAIARVSHEKIQLEEIEQYVGKFTNRLRTGQAEFYWLGQKLSSSSFANLYSCLAEVALQTQFSTRVGN